VRHADVFLGNRRAGTALVNTAGNFVLRAVPEPAMASMMLTGLIAAAALARRRLPKTA
jgi:hypothetical protein